MYHISQFMPVASGFLMCRRASRAFFCSVSEKATQIVDDVLKNRSPTIAEEFSRLQSIPRIRESLSRIEETENYYKREFPFSYYELALDKEKYVSIGRSIELCERLKSSHYVLNHAACGKASIINMVARKIDETANGRSYKHFEPLRHETFLKDIPENRDVSWYKTELRKAGDKGSKVDFDYRNELISADIFLESIRTQCSAIDLFARGKNFCTNLDGFSEHAIENIMGYYSNDKRLIQDICKKVMSLQHVIPDVLYSICVPKESFSSMAYLSWIGGRPAEGEYLIDDLDSWQNGKVKNNEHPPQIRLLTKGLSPKNGVLIIPHSSMNSAEQQELEFKLGKYIKCLLQ